MSICCVYILYIIIQYKILYVYNNVFVRIKIRKKKKLIMGIEFTITIQRFKYVIIDRLDFYYYCFVLETGSNCIWYVYFTGIRVPQWPGIM